MTAIQPNGYDRIEHDDTYNSKNVKLVASTATIYAVVNTSAAGQASIVVDGPVSIKGNITIDSGNIALTSAPTLYAVVNTGAAGVGQSIVTVANPVSIAGNVTLSDSKTFIGLTTVVQASSVRSIAGNVTLSDSKTFIGLVTVGNTVTVGAHGITGNVTLSNSQNFIGLVTVVQSSAVRSIAGNLTLSNSQNFIGLVTVVQSSAVRSIAGNLTITSGTVSLAGNVTLSDAKTYIGLTTTTLGIGTTFIGLVTATSLNAGTTKALTQIPVAMSTSSQATIAVPATNLSVYVTSLLLSSDATVRVSVKSGVTYLTGNATIGITLNPGGGWVQRGSVDSPIYISTASASINIEKFDMTATKANLGGSIIYYTQ